MNGESRLEQALLEYDQAVQKLQQNRKLFDGVLGMGNHPGNAPCHEQLDGQIQDLCEEAAAEGNPEAALSLIRAVFQAERNWKGPEYARLMLVAVQRHTMNLIPCLTGSARKEMAEWYERTYPKRNRLPVQDQILKALKKG